MTSTLDEVLIKRRSIRKYIDKSVSFEKIIEIIQAGTLAPTACNKQAYRFIYIDKNEILKSVYNLGAAHFLPNCHQAILVLYDNRTDNIEYRDNILSAGAVIQNMLLKAAENNVGTCWICNLPSKTKLRKLLTIPREYDPIALITLGYYTETPPPIKRKHELEDLIFTNQFNIAKEIPENISSIKLILKRFIRYIYIRFPKNARLIKIVERFEKKF